MEERKEKKKFNIIIPIFILVLLTFIYIAVSFFYVNRFLPNSYVNEENVSNKKMAEVRKHYMSLRSGKTLVVAGDFGEKLEIPVDKVVDFSTEGLEDIDIQHSLKWVESFFKKTKHTVKVNKHIRDDKLQPYISESNFIKGKVLTEPKDATLTVNNGVVTIQKDVPGNKVDVDKLTALVKDSILEDNMEVKYTDYPQAKVTADSLKPRKKEIEEKINHVIPIDIRGVDYKLDLKSFYSSEQIDMDKLKEFIAKIVDDTDTLDRQRIFKDNTGTDRTVQSGTYGWKINQEETVNKIIKAIKDKNFEKMEPEYTAQGNKDVDIGKTYIEIDLSKQHLWVYENGTQVLDSQLVSGRVPNNYTPVGVHSIKDKVPNKVLKGTNRTTYEEYESFVSYWMPIDWSGIGLHDATWQNGDFSPDKYLDVMGSNGCINLPMATAEYIYANVPIGTPVVIYESSTNYSKNFIP